MFDMLHVKYAIGSYLILNGRTDGSIVKHDKFALAGGDVREGSRGDGSPDSNTGVRRFTSGDSQLAFCARLERCAVFS